MFITQKWTWITPYYLALINAQALDLFSIMCNTDETETVILDCTVLIIDCLSIIIPDYRFLRHVECLYVHVDKETLSLS